MLCPTLKSDELKILGEFAARHGDRHAGRSVDQQTSGNPFVPAEMLYLQISYYAKRAGEREIFVADVECWA
jgi:hypothetical protein